MAETLRKDETLTTADIAGSRDPQAPEEAMNLQDDYQRSREGPTLVHSWVDGRGEPMAREMPGETPSAQDYLAVEPGMETGRRPDGEFWPGADGRNRGTGTLLSENELGDLRSRWSTIQAEFVDEPRRSVERADQLVATAMQRLAERFANERASLEKKWGGGNNVSTEDLRVALQHYRAFFERLLNAA